MVYALSDQRQAKGKLSDFSIEGRTLEAKEFAFADLEFTADLKLVNSMLEPVVTVYVKPEELTWCVARLSYYATSRGYASVHPFAMKFECLDMKGKIIHAVFFTLVPGEISGRKSTEIPFHRMHFHDTHRLRVAPATQACFRCV